MMRRDLALVIATLNLLGLARNPSLYWLSVFTYSGLLLTVETIMTLLSCPWNSSVLPTITSW